MMKCSICGKMTDCGMMTEDGFVLCSSECIVQYHQKNRQKYGDEKQMNGKGFIDEKKIEQGISLILEGFNIDLNDQHFKNGVQRILNGYKEILRGEYEKEPKVTIFDNEDNYDQIIFSGPIPFYSLCAHHFLPFFGHAYVAYLPDRHIVGISKLSRIVDFFARRLTVQEKMTEKISKYILEKLRPQGVGVVIKARHLCMEMRGVRTNGNYLTTSSIHGKFREDQNVKMEFLDLIKISELR